MLVFQLSGQGLAVAGLVAVEIIPVLILGPVAGVVIDRFGRKGILIGSLDELFGIPQLAGAGPAS